MSAEAKYIVFKRQEYNDWWDSQGEQAEVQDLDDNELLDAVVIRLQDIFAASALFSYANTIRTSVEIMDLGYGDTETRDRLDEIADYFMSMAEKAATQDTNKIPD